MKKQVCVVGIVVILVVAVGVVFILGLDMPENDVPFDNGGRYDSTVLNNMGVIYSNQSDIASWYEGYSESDACPWGFIHNSLDYFFYNNSVVIAAAPGVVEIIEVGYLENSTIYKVDVKIKFNESITLEYGFEAVGNETLRAQQVEMLGIGVGDWVAKGDQIGYFFRPNQGAHVHFSVYLNDVSFCPRLVMGQNDYNEIMSLIQAFHPTWELCYP
jgi:murein DD-endopeptidase MepM/ murein hydrolase activator NlpD